MPNYKYIVDILARNGQFIQAMNQNMQKTAAFEANVKKLGGFLAGAFSAGAILEFGKASVQAYNTSIQAETALLTALKGRTDVQQRLIKQASELMGKTLFDDDETVRAQSLVAAFVKEENKIKTLIPLIQDFAQAKQMDLASAADLVTKTLAGEMNALGRYGIKVEGAAGSSERLAQITKGLNDAFGGQAEAAAKVGTAALQQLGMEYGNLQEVIGKLIISQQNQEGSFTKILTNATRGFSSFLGDVATWSDAGFSFTQAIVASLGSTREETDKLAQSMVVANKANADTSKLTTGSADAAKYAKGTYGALGEEITKLNEQLAKTNSNDIDAIQLIGSKIAALEKLQETIKSISSDPASFRTDKLSTINPVSGKARVSLSDKEGKEVDQWGKQLMSMNDMLKTNQQRVDEWKNALIEKQQAITGAFEQGFGQIGMSIVDGLGLAENGLEGFVKSLAETAVQLISMMLAQSIATAIFSSQESAAATGPLAIATAPVFMATAIAGVMSAFAAIPKFADGGIAYGPTMGLMGEYPGARTNPEVIAPLSKLQGMLNQGGSNTVILQPSLEMGYDTFRVRLKRIENNVSKRT